MVRALKREFYRVHKRDMGGVLPKESREGGRQEGRQEVQPGISRENASLSNIRKLRRPSGSLTTLWRLPWSMAGHTAPPPLLRVYWPLRLAIPADSEVQLLGERGHGNAHELFVAGAAAAGGAVAAAAVGSAVGARRFAAQGTPGADSSSAVFIMQPAVKPRGGVPPIPLLAPAHPATGASRTRQHAAQQQPQCQVVLYDGSAPPQLENSSSSAAYQDAKQPRQPWLQPRQHALAARLASHLLGALLAWALLANSQWLAAAASAGGARLADFAAGQLAWYMTAQPAGGCCISCACVWWLAVFGL